MAEEYNTLWKKLKSGVTGIYIEENKAESSTPDTTTENTNASKNPIYNPNQHIPFAYKINDAQF